MNLELVWMQKPQCTTHNSNLEKESCADQTQFACSLVCVEIVQSFAEPSCHMHNLYCTTGLFPTSELGNSGVELSQDRNSKEGQFYYGMHQHTRRDFCITSQLVGILSCGESHVL